MRILRRIIQEDLDYRYNELLRAEGVMMAMLRARTYGNEANEDNGDILERNHDIVQRWVDLKASTQTPSLIRFFTRQQRLFHEKKLRYFHRLVDLDNEEQRWEEIEALRQQYGNVQESESENEERKE